MAALTDTAFAEIPPIGLAVSVRGQRYDLVGIGPYTKRDGTTIEMLVWQTNCDTCGVGFQARSKVLVMPQSRRCEAHRQPGRAATVAKVGQ